MLFRQKGQTVSTACHSRLAKSDKVKMYGRHSGKSINMQDVGFTS